MNTEKTLWIERARQGDNQAFSQLVELYQRPVYNLCYRMLGESGEAEDAAQETFIRAYTRLATYDPNRNFSSWLLAIASHYCIDQLRTRRSSPVSWDDLDCGQWLPTPQAGPEEMLLNREKRDYARNLLNLLPPHYRASIILLYWHGLSYDEIAQTLDLTVSAIKSVLYRARQMMAQAVAQGKAPTRLDYKRDRDLRLVAGQQAVLSG